MHPLKLLGSSIVAAIKFIAVKTIFSNNVGKMITLLSGDVYKIKLATGRAVNIYVDKLDTECPTIARLFFNSYERHERKLLKKYFIGSELIIELGSSLGVVTCELAEKCGGSKIIAIEANTKLISNLQKTVNFNFPESRVKIINCYVTDDCYAYSYIPESDSLQGRTVVKPVHNELEIRISPGDLLNLVNSYGCSKYSLVSDIEGAEYFLIFTNNGLLDRCQEISIELHDFIFDNKVVTIAQMRDELIRKGFRLISISGRAHYFCK